jgi:hypothetical protein
MTPEEEVARVVADSGSVTVLSPRGMVVVDVRHEGDAEPDFAAMWIRDYIDRPLASAPRRPTS